MNLCGEGLVAIYELIGNILLIAKFLILIILIIYGIFDYYKAVVNPEENKLKKVTSRFIKRIVAGLLIFFIPNIILTFFHMIDFDESKYACMYSCVLDTSTCSKHIDNSELLDGDSVDGSETGLVDDDLGTNETFCSVLDEDCISYAIYEN